MHSFVDSVSNRQSWQKFAALALVSLLSPLGPGGFAASAHAQASCSSDGQPRPAMLLERFINADCEACWKDPAAPAPGPRQAALDWVIPGSKGDDAALSPVANRAGLARLQALDLPLPSASLAGTHAVTGVKGASLRVAHGLALAGYMGVSIELKRTDSRAAQQPLKAWLALVESIPEGTEGTPIPRNLIRNVLQINWNDNSQLSKKERPGLLERRVMSVAAGVNPDKLHVIGWVEDAKGTVLFAAQSRCK